MSWLTNLFDRKPASVKSDVPFYFHNTLTGARELFSPLRAGSVTMYSCGPTVYGKQHIGNLKAPLFADLVARVLSEAGFNVKRVINITDVGHLQSDGDEGEDKMEVGAKRDGMRASDIAERYAKLFLDDIKAIGLDLDQIRFPRATEYIKEQIEMVAALEKKDLTYRTHDGIYFDTALFPAYGKLGNIQPTHSREEAVAGIGRRITENKEKRQPADFALWKFSPKGGKREQEWSSPWGLGFPGWHIECSAMIKALLGTEIDIHTGGIDHIPVHHNNEIAQSESANERPLARFWMHEAFVTVADEKISKSLGNDVYLSDIIERGYHPLALRYFFLQAHYRTPISFTWDALDASSEALKRLWRLSRKIHDEAKGRTKASDTSRRMTAILRDDLATPQALALLWETVRDEDMDRSEQLAVINAADAVLGLSLVAGGNASSREPVPEHIQALIMERELARKAGDFGKADAIRIHIGSSGYLVEDGPSGPIVTRT